jgi:alkylhydroperoxidase family enzyme
MHLRRPVQPRVQPIAKVAARAAERAATTDATPVNMQATLHHNRTVSKALGALSSIFFDAELLAPRLREIAILRMAWNTQSQYEFGQHTLIARTAGLDDAEIERLTWPIALGRWTDAEATVIQMVDDLYVDDCVSDSTWADLEAQFDTATTIALMAAPLCYRMAAGLFNSLGIELDDGVPGWPEGR